MGERVPHIISDGMKRDQRSSELVKRDLRELEVSGWNSKQLIGRNGLKVVHEAETFQALLSTERERKFIDICCANIN